MSNRMLLGVYTMEVSVLPKVELRKAAWSWKWLSVLCPIGLLVGAVAKQF